MATKSWADSELNIPATGDLGVLAGGDWWGPFKAFLEIVAQKLQKTPGKLDIDFYYYSASAVKLFAGSDFPLGALMLGHYYQGHWRPPLDAQGKPKTPYRVISSVINSTLDGGQSALKANTAYAVWATAADVAAASPPTITPFAMVLTPFIRVYGDAASTITASQHASKTAQQLYGFTSNIYANSILLVLTGALAGSIKTVSGNAESDGSQISYSGGALGLTQGDFISVSPAGAVNYRYLGSVITDASGNILSFVKKGEYFQLDAALQIGAVTGAAFAAKDISGYCSPLAKGASGYITGSSNSYFAMLSWDGTNIAAAKKPVNTSAQKEIIPITGFFKTALSVYLKNTQTAGTTTAFLQEYFE